MVWRSRLICIFFLVVGHVVLNAIFLFQDVSV